MKNSVELGWSSEDEDPSVRKPSRRSLSVSDDKDFVTEKRGGKHSRSYSEDETAKKSRKSRRSSKAFEGLISGKKIS